MPGRTADSGNAVVPLAPEVQRPAVYRHPHGISCPIRRVSLSWANGNCLRVSSFRRSPDDGNTVESDGEGGGGSVVELKLGAVDEEAGDLQFRRIVYGSVAPFAHLRNMKNSVAALTKNLTGSSPYEAEWWEYVMEYSKEIGSLLGSPKSTSNPIIENPKTILKKAEEPTCLKAAWELLETFYADKQCQAWLPERLVDWLTDFDSLLSGTQKTVHAKLMDFQNELVGLQAVEDSLNYWEGMSSALAVGWLDIVVKMLRLHGSYQLNQLGSHQTENGLVEAVAVLISKIPRMRLEMKPGRLGRCYGKKPDFVKAWEEWRAQITALDCSSFWVQCGHRQTREGLRSMLQIMLGNANSLCTATCNWIELFISHFLYIKPFTMGLESLNILAQKCLQLKPMLNTHRLMGLLSGILEENTEVVLAECSKGFGPWLPAHAMELLTTGSKQAEIVLGEEGRALGGISIEELHLLIYAQVLSSHTLTWQVAPVYLTSCMKQGRGLLELFLLNQPVQHSQTLLKNIEICRLYELEDVSSTIMKIAGVYHWKHGRKGCGVFWLQQARDEVRLNRIARHLFDFIGKSVSDESFEQWDGLIELLGSKSKTAGGLEFLLKYRDFKKSLKQVYDGKIPNAARQAVESLILLMRNPCTPHCFWLPLLYDSVSLLRWEECPIVDASQTSLLLNKLQELSMARLHPDFVEAGGLPPEAESSIRLALGMNLARAVLEE